VKDCGEETSDSSPETYKERDYGVEHDLEGGHVEEDTGARVTIARG
jgi:hypothetical protein